MPNNKSKDPTVDACRGPKPNSENITKIEKLYERGVLIIYG